MFAIKTMRRCLLLLSVIIFLADLADDGRLGATRPDIQRHICHSYGFTQDSPWGCPLDLKEFLVEHALHWQKPNFFPGNGPGFITTLPGLPQLPGRISRVSFPVICPWDNPYFTGGGCGGLPS